MKTFALRLMSALAVVLTGLGVARAQEDVEYVELLDTSRVVGHVEKIQDATATIRTESGSKSVHLDEVAGIHYQPAQDLMRQQGQNVLKTRTGMVLLANDLKAPKDKLFVEIENPLLGSARLELSQLNVIYFQRSDLSPQAVDLRCEEGLLIRKGFDTLVVEADKNRWVGVGGVFQGLAGDEILFKYKGEDRKVDKNKVAAVVVTHTREAEKTKTAGMLFGLKGTKVVFTSLALADGQYVVDVPGLGTRRIRASQVSRVRILSDKVVDLADLTPSKVEEKGLFDRTYHYRRNESVSGKPLTLDRRQYASGLGLHSYAKLTWQIDGQYRKLVAMVGIDDAVRPNGDATVRFLGDGKALCDPIRLTGRDKAKLVDLNLDEVKDLTLIVEFGQDSLGVADHVNLVAGRLIRKTEDE
jgi:hypothetical protein